MHRRNFLHTSLRYSSAAALCAAPISAQSSAQGSAQSPPPNSAPNHRSSVMLWTLKGPFEQKLEIAAHAGLQSVELVDEHLAWSDSQIEEKKRFARSLHLGMDTLIAQPSWKTRPVSMVRPEHSANFLADLDRALVFAQKLEIPQVILMSGDEVPGRTHEEQYQSLLDNSRRAADLAAKANLQLIIEPLNSKVDHHDFFLTTCVEGLKLVKQVDNPHFRLLFDIYHEQVQTGNVIRTLKAAAPYVAVFHIADNPGRNDPGSGEMNYANIYQAIAGTGYKGYVTMEYLPIGDQLQSLTRSVSSMRAALNPA
ncbi:MAG TPA: TIM barrel protein [Bryobacteraceae bacterium]|nr:TIM barrel protein [Bryobacteraceae bacterium]